MSTYHNSQIPYNKDYIVVNQNDRATDQEVKLLNEKNVFWGTFAGLSTDISSYQKIHDVMTCIVSNLSGITV